ncbi:MAG: hypothetical protein ABI604_10130 [Nitrospirota bacterium]
MVTPPGDLTTPGPVMAPPSGIDKPSGQTRTPAVADASFATEGSGFQQRGRLLLPDTVEKDQLWARLGQIDPVLIPPNIGHFALDQ